MKGNMCLDLLMGPGTLRSTVYHNPSEPLSQLHWTHHFSRYNEGMHWTLLCPCTQVVI